MARNAEKARSMLNRWSDMRKEEKFGKEDRRPALTTMEDSLERASGWRMEIVKEVARMINEVQNESLDHHRLRDLNDQINKRMRLKRAWEHRVVELGGPNYLGIHPTQFVDAGIAPDMKGGAYRYYGAAKNLPGVRELLANSLKTEHRAHRSLEQIRRSINVSYYGYLDEDDGELIKAESEGEKRLRDEQIREWNEEESEREKRLRTESSELEGRKEAAVSAAALMKKPVKATTTVDSGFKSHVTLPSQEEIEAVIIKRKKMALLKQYASPALQAQVQEGSGK